MQQEDENVGESTRSSPQSFVRTLLVLLVYVYTLLLELEVLVVCLRVTNHQSPPSSIQVDSPVTALTEYLRPDAGSTCILSFSTVSSATVSSTCT